MQKIVRLFLLGLIEFYRLCISPFMGKSCRFYPSCSDYAYTALSRHGIFYGLWLTFSRILKCGPWHAGGVDLVPEENK